MKNDMVFKMFRKLHTLREHKDFLGIYSLVPQSVIPIPPCCFLILLSMKTDIIFKTTNYESKN